jgi:hypothetical protein
VGALQSVTFCSDVPPCASLSPLRLIESMMAWSSGIGSLNPVCEWREETEVSRSYRSTRKQGASGWLRIAMSKGPCSAFGWADPIAWAQDGARVSQSLAGNNSSVLESVSQSVTAMLIGTNFSPSVLGGGTRPTME